MSMKSTISGNQASTSRPLFWSRDYNPIRRIANEPSNQSTTSTETWTSPLVPAQVPSLREQRTQEKYFLSTTKSLFVQSTPTMPLTLARRGPAVVFRQLAPVAPRVRSGTAVEFNITRHVSSLSKPNLYRPVVGSKLPKVVFPRTELNGFSSTSAAAAASTTTKTKTSSKKKRGRKALTEKQKEAKARRERNEDIKELKKIALKDEEPKPKSVNPWSLYISSRLKAEPTSKPSERLKELREDFKNLSPEEREVRFRFLCLERSC